MALQKKTYIGGNSSYTDAYKGFVLTLEIIENSISQTDNTSNISYELVLSNPGNNYNYNNNQTRYIDLQIGDEDLSGSVGGNWSFNSSTSSKTLLKGTIDIEHDEDGTLTAAIYAKMPPLREDGLGPEEIIIEDEIELTPITQTFTLSLKSGEGVESFTILTSENGTDTGESYKTDCEYQERVYTRAKAENGYHLTQYYSEEYDTTEYIEESNVTTHDNYWTIYQDRTVYVYAEPNTYTNEIDPNGGYRVSDSNTSIIAFSRKYGEIKEITERRRDGYILVGYTITNSDNGSTTDIGGATLSFDDSTKTARFIQGYKPITLTAQWEKDILPVQLNGYNDIKQVIYNGQSVNHLYFNEIQVF